MSPSDPLLTAALLGTERAPWRVPSAPEPLARLLRQLSADDPEQALLHAIALTRLHRQAGTLSVRPSLGLAPPCPPEDKPILSRRATALLPQLLSPEHGPLLQEWLQRAAALGRVLPPEYLPLLLQLGDKRPALRSVIAALAGRRGQWLAAQHPDGRWHVPPDVATMDWDTASTAERAGVLSQLRAADPASARDRLESTWSQGSAEERVTLLRTLAQNLSLADEEFLERALDDRSVAVRREAASLLSGLVGSRLVQRMTQRMRPRVAMERRGLLRRPVLEVKLLEEHDKDLERDGVAAQMRQAGGERAHWTQQALSMVPPSRWEAHLDLTPEALVEAAARGDWNDLLFHAWLAAAVRFRDARWVAVLCRARPAIVEVNVAAFQLLPPNEQEQLVRALLDQMKEKGSGAALAAVGAGTWPWTEEFARHVLSRIAAFSGHSDMTSWTHTHQARTALRQVTVRVPMSLADELAQSSFEPLQELAAALRLRRSYHDAFDAEGSPTA